ncbi:hypothetical protein Rsub_01156 [Raphidocelis subcapitata]|uniref:Uncharacterized protein n=1 Tax=Raphidocelis subcapitata TaxID=307507 RepID=A0A2V0NLX3_9CHLO|nr:hypothetical protein Rsub_01156 [Raphidocelis subcapitata]|eukprot:GBF88444.1 hypothetical protein Rsub_01156 [Raphidocelis subcapitata]
MQPAFAVRQGTPAEAVAVPLLVEDRSAGQMGYSDFLVAVLKQVMSNAAGATHPPPSGVGSPSEHVFSVSRRDRCLRARSAPAFRALALASSDRRRFGSAAFSSTPDTVGRYQAGMMQQRCQTVHLSPASGLVASPQHPQLRGRVQFLLRPTAAALQQRARARAQARAGAQAARSAPQQPGAASAAEPAASAPPAPQQPQQQPGAPPPPAAAEPSASAPTAAEPPRRPPQAEPAAEPAAAPPGPAASAPAGPHQRQQAAGAEPPPSAAAAPAHLPTPTTATHEGRRCVVDALCDAVVAYNNPGSPSPSVRGTLNKTSGEGMVVEADALEAAFKRGKELLAAGADPGALSLHDAACALLAAYLGGPLGCFGRACQDGGTPRPVVGAVRVYDDGDLKAWHAHGSDRASDSDLGWRRCLLLLRVADDELSPLCFRGGNLSMPWCFLQPFATACISDSVSQGEGLDRTLGAPGEFRTARLRWEHAAAACDPATGKLVGSRGRALTFMVYLNDRFNDAQLPQHVAECWRHDALDPEAAELCARLEARVISGYTGKPRPQWIAGPRVASMTAKVTWTASSSLAERREAAGGAGVNSAVSTARGVVQALQDWSELKLRDCDRRDRFPTTRGEYVRAAAAAAHQELMAQQYSGRYVAAGRRREVGAAGIQRLVTWPLQTVDEAIRLVRAHPEPPAGSHHLQLGGTRLAFELQRILNSKQIQSLRRRWARDRGPDGSWEGIGGGRWALAWLHAATDDAALAVAGRVVTGAAGCSPATAALITLARVATGIGRNAQCVEFGLHPYPFTPNELLFLATIDLPAARELQRFDMQVTSVAAAHRMKPAELRRELEEKGVTLEQWRAVKKEEKLGGEAVDAEAAVARQRQREEDKVAKAEAAAARKRQREEDKEAKAEAAAARKRQREEDKEAKAEAAAARKKQEGDKKAKAERAAAHEKRMAEFGTLLRALFDKHIMKVAS